MILLVIAVLLLPTAMVPRQEFYPVEKVELEARDAGFPPQARRAVVVTRTGGVSPIKTLNVKIFEKETELKTVHVQYIVVYHNRDYVMAERKVDFDAYEALWLELHKNRVFFLDSPAAGAKDKPTYIIRVKEVKKETSFTVTDPEAMDDKRYANVVAAVEAFWRDNLKIQ